MTVGDGWAAPLEPLFAALEAAAASDENFQLLQVKEKLGTLRVYYRPWNAQLSDAIALAEARCAQTCDVCGREGILTHTASGLATRCAADT